MGAGQGNRAMAVRRPAGPEWSVLLGFGLLSLALGELGPGLWQQMLRWTAACLRVAAADSVAFPAADASRKSQQVDLLLSQGGALLLQALLWMVGALLAGACLGACVFARMEPAAPRGQGRMAGATNMGVGHAFARLRGLWVLLFLGALAWEFMRELRLWPFRGSLSALSTAYGGLLLAACRRTAVALLLWAPGAWLFLRFLATEQDAHRSAAVSAGSTHEAAKALRGALRSAARTALSDGGAGRSARRTGSPP